MGVLFYTERNTFMIEADALKTYLEDLSDIPEEYRPGFTMAAAMIDFELLLEHLADEKMETLFPFIRRTLLTAVLWSEKFAKNTSILQIELLKSGLGRGLFALQCTGTRNFSQVEWQIKRGIRSFIIAKENNGKMPKIKVKTVSGKPEKCPFCRSDDIKEIVYGLPSADFDYSKYISGGCCVSPDSPKWHCDNCFAKFKQSSKRSKKYGIS